MRQQAEIALMTQSFSVTQNLEVAESVVKSIEPLGVQIESVSISDYYKFESSSMIVFNIYVEEWALIRLKAHLDELSQDWKSTNKGDPANHRILDLRGSASIYGGAVWVAFDVV